MADKLGEQVPPPGVGRMKDAKSWKEVSDLKSAPVVIADEEGNQAGLSAADVAELDKDEPAKGIACTSDEMGAFNPVLDRSANVEYYFYRCQNKDCTMGQNKKPRKVFAEGREEARRESVECQCILLFEGKDGKFAPKMKGWQNPKIDAPQYVHGEMRLYHFLAARPKE